MLILSSSNRDKSQAVFDREALLYLLQARLPFPCETSSFYLLRIELWYPSAKLPSWAGGALVPGGPMGGHQPQQQQPQPVKQDPELIPQQWRTAGPGLMIASGFCLRDSLSVWMESSLPFQWGNCRIYWACFGAEVSLTVSLGQFHRVYVWTGKAIGTTWESVANDTENWAKPALH
eukprot:1147923-Pelagomonas_calceolata.AAC.3